MENISSQNVQFSDSSVSNIARPSTSYDADSINEQNVVYGNLFQRHFDSENGVISADKVRLALYEIGLYPSRAQVEEMLQSAAKYGHHDDSFLTQAEFTFMASELNGLYSKCLGPPVAQCKVTSDNDLIQNRYKRSMSGIIKEPFQVFLGGSCNPTTWRRDDAIPYLKQHGVTYYNPQVEKWHPALIEIEDQAKLQAHLLFFVIDNKTRSTVSMLEAAYLAGCGKQLILVIRYCTENCAISQTENISEEELEELYQVRTWLLDVVERTGIPVFTDLKLALECAVKCIKQGLSVQQLSTEHGATPVKNGHLRVGHRLVKIHDAFHSVNKEETISQKDLCHAFRVLHGCAITRKYIRDKKRCSHGYKFDDFLAIVNETDKRERMSARNRSPLYKALCSIQKLPKLIKGWFSRSSNSVENSRDVKHVYLVSNWTEHHWKDNVVIPTFIENRLTYVDASQHGWDETARRQCQLLFYVVAMETKSIITMVQAGHDIGQGYNVVLVIEQTDNDKKAKNFRQSIHAVNDHERACMYLVDIAKRENIPVFSRLKDAADFTVEQLKGNVQ
ncbi:unnamed protein product [Owenia fusiformis]|uniref:Uncharacterized protein n=1 Tax=Owenia fusiformis TaxID=6347 RepID=A0A8J1XUZ7_OWEFU|nr:unnamed protein product [Owenia fusiformis]CAH1787161.1 unnamed protein product [Owenia fusiformis]